MEIRKVRGENRIHPVRMSRVQYELALKLGLKPEEYVKAYLEDTAKRRRWKWFFERKGDTK